MSNQANNDEEVLAEFVREAGSLPSSPDPHYAAKLRATILDRVAFAKTIAHATEAAPEADVVSPTIAMKRTINMQRIARFAVAATILAALGIFVSWTIIGSGATNIAFAAVADALDKIHSATFDITTEIEGQEKTSGSTKGFFLAPSHQRIETTVKTEKGSHSMITIMDGQATKGITLLPEREWL